MAVFFFFFCIPTYAQKLDYDGVCVMAAAGPARKRARTTGSHQLTISESFARRDKKEGVYICCPMYGYPLSSSHTPHHPHSPHAAKQEMASLTEVIDLSTPPLLHPSPSPNCTPPESPLLFSNPSSPCSSESCRLPCRKTLCSAPSAARG